MDYLEQTQLLRDKAQKLQAEIHHILENYTPTQRKKLLGKQYLLTNIRGKLKFLRPNNAVDVDYRRRKIQFFDMRLKGLLSDDDPIVFHGTPIYNSEKILLSGRIVSGKDLWTVRTSGDLSNQVSVTTKQNFKYTNIFYAGLGSYNQFLPAGCIFAIRAKDDSEFQMARQSKHIHNVLFRDNPNRLLSIITTPENLSRVKGWVKKYGHTVPVYDYDGFTKKLCRVKRLSARTLASCTQSH